MRARKNYTQAEDAQIMEIINEFPDQGSGTFYARIAHCRGVCKDRTLESLAAHITHLIRKTKPDSTLVEMALRAEIEDANRRLDAYKAASEAKTAAYEAEIVKLRAENKSLRAKYGGIRDLTFSSATLHRGYYSDGLRLDISAIRDWWIDNEKDLFYQTIDDLKKVCSR